jgi:FkbM family methyltransferase
MFIRALNEHWIWKRRLRVSRHLFRAPTFDRLASLWMHKLGILGRDEIRILRQLLRPGMTVFDIGANQGVYALLFADLVRPGRVFAFEPEPVIFQQLVLNVNTNKAENVLCHNLAVSSSSGRLALKRGGINWGDNRILPGSSRVPGQINVEAIALDEKFAHQKIDFLKIDIQGWEAEALFGARGILEENIDLVVMFELWPYGLLRAGASPEALFKFMGDLGFQFWHIEKGTLVNFDRKDLPDPKNQFSYCNLVGTRNQVLIEHLLN